ncbi:antirestriction protein [Chimaeribacter californicus]|uniref:Antirestriction protein n=1 Tax=Chimaeribacter californicus TaxID=2060067 RepID=A0A2N5E334_9GAMM|nr:antirestriction protein [Chimaeribacter californicus]PLR35113.1 antirestriction protein [Chimaeribacter californicus]
MSAITMRPVSVGTILFRLPDAYAREAIFLSWAGRLSDDYDGGLWAGRMLSNGGYYLVPVARHAYRVCVVGNGYDGVMTAEAFGITLSLFALGHIANITEMDSDISAYHTLRDYALEHSESGAILAAID